MLTLTPMAAAAIAIVCGAWLAVALWACFWGLSLRKSARLQLRSSARSEALLRSQNGVAAVAARDGALEADDRLAGLLGLDRAPASVEELCAGERGLAEQDKTKLCEEIGNASATAGSF